MVYCTLDSVVLRGFYILPKSGNKGGSWSVIRHIFCKLEVKVKKITLCVLSVFFCVLPLWGQSRASFLSGDSFQDVIVTVAGGGLEYTVTLGPNPAFVYQSVAYPITDLFGFWVLSNDDDLFPVHSDIGVWRAHENQAGTGGIAGWHTNPNTGLTPGQQFTFTFDSLNVASVEQFGFHIRVNGTFPGTNGNTGYATVPEPATGSALGVLAVLLGRRFRARSQNP